MPVFASKLVQQVGQGRHLLRHGDLRQGDDEVVRHLAAAGLGQRRDAQIQRPHRALVAFQRKGLDADADEGRQNAARDARGQFLADVHGVGVFLLVRPVAIAVLEVDTIVFHRLALQFLAHALVDGVGHPGRFVGEAGGVRILFDDRGQVLDVGLAVGQRGGAGQAQGLGEHDKVGRVHVQVAQGDATQLAGRVCLEQVRTAVDRMNGLPAGRVARIPFLEIFIRRLELLHDGGDGVGGEG